MVQENLYHQSFSLMKAWYEKLRNLFWRSRRQEGSALDASSGRDQPKQYTREEVVAMSREEFGKVLEEQLNEGFREIAEGTEPKARG